MRIHSDILDRADLFEARAYAASKGEGQIYWNTLSSHGSKSRNHAFNVKLEGDGTVGKRRVNYGTASGERWSDRPFAATWNQWGWFLGYLFAIDPDMTCTYYSSADDFHAKTRFQFVTENANA
jgi:hypothetical protein